MSFTLPVLVSSADSFSKEPPIKTEGEPTIIKPLALKLIPLGTPPQKNQLSHLKDPTNQNTEKFLSAGMVQRDSPNTDLSTLSLSSYESTPSLLEELETLSDDLSLPSIKTSSSFSKKEFGRFDISRANIKPIVDILPPSKQTPKKISSILDRCLLQDPSILESTSAKKTKKIAAAVAVLFPPSSRKASDTPSSESTDSPSSPSTDSPSSASTDSFSESINSSSSTSITPVPFLKNEFASFSISRRDLELIDPNLGFSKTTSQINCSSIRKARAILDQCINKDPSIVYSSGTERSNKIKIALEKVNTFRATPLSLPPISSMSEN